MVFAWFYKGFRLMPLFQIEKRLVLATQERNPADMRRFPDQDKQIAPDVASKNPHIFFGALLVGNLVLLADSVLST